PGVYTVKLRITTNTGCQDSIIKNNLVTINGPTANFNAAVTQGCNSLNAQFNDLSTSGGVSPIATRVWDFGDGTIVTNPSAPVTHLYTVQGIYPVKLKVTDAAGCSDSLFRPSYITLAVPVAKFTTSDSNYCPSSKIQFSDSSVGGFNRQYLWDFGDGTTSTQQFPPLHTYPFVNKYTVKLMITDLLTSCTSTYTKVNYINIDTPNANFIMDNNFASCPPLLVHFTFAGHYAKSVLWNFGPSQGVSDSLNTQYLYAFPNVYQPSLTVTSPGGCIVSTSQTVTVNGPVATFTYSPTGGCDTLTVNFSVAAAGVVGYTWYFGNHGDSLTTSVPFTTYTYNQAGYYQPFLRVIDTTNCSVIYPGPTPIIVDSVKARFVMDKNLLCEDGFVNFTDSSFKMVGTKIINYFWDFGDGPITASGPGDSLINHFYSVPGLYTVKEIVTTQDGCTDSIVAQVKVVANPVIDIGGIISQCVPATLHFQGVVLAPDTSALTWKWNFGNGQTLNGPDTATQFYNQAGQFTIQLVAINSSGCTDTATNDLFIYPLPIVNAGNDTTICLGTSAQLTANGAASYIWIAPAGLACPTCQTIIDQPTVNTTYIVQGMSALGCVALDTVVVTVNQPVTITVSPDDSLCIGQSRPLVATGAALYTWTPATGLSNPNIANPMASPSTTTTYQVIGSDNKFCFFDTGFVKVTVFNYPTINAGPDATINVGSSYQIGASGSPDIVSLNWLPVNGLSCTTCYSPVATPNSTTTYVATVVNNGGCATADSIRITVICNNANFFVPNTFSPNGDGVNDVFYVRGTGLNIVPSLTIFNRWGQIVFQKRDFAPNDPSAGWDGTFNGQKAPVDVYIYTLEIICDNSEIIPIHGNVALIR
ncbi:MAG: PKD domain-containing protein, partial [Chitinophagales bacterium]